MFIINGQNKFLKLIRKSQKLIKDFIQDRADRAV